jgi:putative nucleotidyltransferase with HDIG domain
VSEELDPRAAAKNILTLRNGGIALLYLITFFLISPPPRLPRVDLKEGMRHDSKNILAQVNFEVIDEEATRLAKERAASLEPPVYVIDPDLLLSSISDAGKQFDKIQQDALNPLFSKEERIALLSKYLHSSTSEGTLTLLAGLDQEGFDLLRSASLKAIEATQSKGILSDVPGSAKNISIYDGSAPKWRLAEVDDVLTLIKAAEELKRKAREEFPKSPAYRDALVELSTPFITGTLRFDEMLTENARSEVIKSTPPVMKTFETDDLIVGSGDDVTHQDMIELMAHARALGRANLVNIKRYIGNALLLLMVFGCFLFYLRRYLPEVLKNNKGLLLVAIMVLMTLVTGWLFIVFSLPTAWLYAVPVAAGAILLSILTHDRMALVYCFFISVLYAIQGNYHLSFFLLGIFGSLVGIYYMRAIRRRSDVMRPGVAVAVANVVTILILYLIGILDEDLEWALLAGVANGLATAIMIVPGTLSVLEWALGIVTNIRLLELSDLNQPLLKQMAMQAPGTYHHSLMVGNLAEAAAEEIGANSLLARVGSYYHDVGKMTKPAYFSENQRGSKNRHDELTPSMSALVLTAHEKDGIELAREHRLNQPIIDFIEQHHGTSLMTFFYQKAMEQSGGEDVDDDIFRYPGPRPQTREIAICMLADSVEAASRTLTNPTHGRIKGIVQKIVNNKYVDAQLYESDLTLKDINGIVDSFVRTLAGYLHSRIEYPEEQTVSEIKEKFEDSDSKVGAKNGNKNRSNKESH